MKYSIESLKRKAKKLKKEQGVSHAKALDTMARSLGFGTWSLLMKNSEDGENINVNRG